MFNFIKFRKTLLLLPARLEAKGMELRMFRVVAKFQKCNLFMNRTRLFKFVSPNIRSVVLKES